MLVCVCEIMRGLENARTGIIGDFCRDYPLRREFSELASDIDR